MQLAGIAHVQLTVSDLARSRPFYRALCQHFEMHCQYELEGNATESGILYFIGGKTGLAIRAAKPEHADARYHQYKPGLHHLCFRARGREDIDRFHAFFVAELVPLGGKLVHPPRTGPGRPAITRSCSRIRTAFASRSISFRARATWRKA